MCTSKENLNNFWIEKVVHAFYEKATVDIFIGHHFRRIIAMEGHPPLTPPIEAFEEHLERISHFWKMQLTDFRARPNPPFYLIRIHIPMSIKKGEIDRWMTLFYQTLDQLQDQENQELFESWREKLEIFRRRFYSSLGF